MVSGHTARFVVGIIGNVISIFLFLSPVPTFVKIIKAKSVQAYKPDPYVVTVINCAMWVFYGMPFVHPDSLLVVTINGAGFFIELVYVTIFVVYSSWGKRRRVIRTKSVKYMPFYLSLASFANGLCWTAYALIKLDPFVLIPNAMGSVSGAVQLILYATYYKSTNWDEEEKPASAPAASTSEIQLSDNASKA
ncbi:hypothetical protein LguiA_009502 [Lonicera macranthoides]